MGNTTMRAGYANILQYHIRTLALKLRGALVQNYYNLKNCKKDLWLSLRIM